MNSSVHHKALLDSLLLQKKSRALLLTIFFVTQAITIFFASRTGTQQGPLHSVPKNLRSSCDQRDLQDSFPLYVALFCYVPSRKYSKDISHFYDPLCGKYWIVEKLSSLSFNLSLVSYKQNKKDGKISGLDKTKILFIYEIWGEI